jgi:solute carrier family 34 (sodium-dependent phosphate cotransporter)
VQDSSARCTSHSVKRSEFEKVVPATIVGEVYKILNVMLFACLESLFGFLQKSARFVAGLISGQSAQGLNSAQNWLEMITQPAVDLYVNSTKEVFTTQSSQIVVVVLMTLFLAHLSLRAVSLSVQQLFQQLQGSLEFIQKTKSKPLMMFIGFGVCWVLQSSTLTLSLILPLKAHSVVSLSQVFY